MGKGKESAIPVGTQFSPNLVSLPRFIQALLRHSGDRPALLKAIWASGVRTQRPKAGLTPRRQSLPLEAAIQYGLLQPSTYEATDLTGRLATLSESDLYEEFARHVLLKCGGLRILEGVRQMQADNLKVTSDTLARFLTSQGFAITEHNSAINSLRQWLAKAEVFPQSRTQAWVINEVTVKKLLNLSTDDIQILAGLNPQQTAFLEGLCAIDPTGWTPANVIRDWAESCRGVRLGRASLPKEVLNVLQSLGLIDYRTKGTGGGKTSELHTTSKFRSDVLRPFVESAIANLDATISSYYKRRPEDIFAGLESSDKNIKGQALEAFAIFVMRLLHLRFVGWRKRAEAEVDALLEGVMGPIATRWQVQCKNTPKSVVRVDDVAKEVGLLTVTRATHILFVANCRFSGDAHRYAREVMKNNPVGLYLLDHDDFERLRVRPESIGSILREKAADLLEIDRPPLFHE